RWACGCMQAIWDTARLGLLDACIAGDCSWIRPVIVPSGAVMGEIAVGARMRRTTVRGTGELRVAMRNNNRILCSIHREEITQLRLANAALRLPLQERH